MLRAFFCLFIFHFAQWGHAQSLGTPITVTEQGLLLSSCGIGSENGQCVWDTGANMSFVAETPASASFPLIAQFPASCEGSKIVVDVVRAPSIRVGGLSNTETQIARTNIYSGLPFYLGVLGSDLLLSSHQVIFDIVKIFDPISQLYSQPTMQMRKTFSSFGKIIPAGKLALKVTVDGVPATAMWDTHTYTTFKKSFIAKNPQMFQKKRSEVGGNVCGGSFTTSIYDLKKKICFGDHCLSTAEVMDSNDDGGISDAQGTSFDLVIGLDMIDQATWFFDFETHQYSVRTR